MNTNKNNRQWKLMTTVSAAALMANIGCANAADDHPMFWLDLGWHYEDSIGLGDKFHPAFADAVDQAHLLSVLKPQNQMGYGYGGEGRIAFRPEDSDWIYSLSVRYGRAHGHKDVHQQLQPPTATFIFSAPAYNFFRSNQVSASTEKFSGASTSSGETHAIVDFKAEKDVGLGSGGSVFGFGVRYADFGVKTGAQLEADPDLHFVTVHRTFGNFHFIQPWETFNSYVASAKFSRTFRGAGPSVSWDGFMPMIGDADDGEVSLDWGANAALLFGRQKASGHHHTHDRYFNQSHYQGTTRYDVSGDIARSHAALVPNIGGFAGLSLRWTNAKLSVGYRADYFANAIDGGIDSRKETAKGFFGPFASISIGVSPSDF